MLFGRRTYEDFAAFWPQQKDNPFTAVLNARRKYVVSTTLTEPVPWRNSTLLAGDAAETVARLKERSDSDLTVLGSGALVRTLLRHGLVDELFLSIDPLLLGTGQRLFAEESPLAALRLAESVTTATGVIIATYRPVESATGTR